MLLDCVLIDLQLLKLCNSSKTNSSIVALKLLRTISALLYEWTVWEIEIMYSWHKSSKHLWSQVACVVFFSIAFNVPRLFQYDILYTDENNSNDTNTTILALNRLTDLTTPTPVGPFFTATDANPLTAAVTTSSILNQRFPTYRRSAFGRHVVFEVIYSNALYTSLILILPLVLLVAVNAKLILVIQVERWSNSIFSFKIIINLTNVSQSDT